MGFKCGIIGLPNVGKSTLFNALTESHKAEIANYPFATIEPNIGKVAVYDERLKRLSKINKSEKTIPAYIDFVDIAGLVKGASTGEGLGNKFLSYIREVEAIVHVVRCFEDENITHVSSSIDPIKDIEIINIELKLADLEKLQVKSNSLQKKAKSNDKKIKMQFETINKIIKQINEDKKIIDLDWSTEQKKFIHTLNLITTKPVLYVCNVDEKSIVDGNIFSKQVDERAKKENYQYVNVSAAIESQIAELKNEKQERADFEESNKISLPRAVEVSLGLIERNNQNLKSDPKIVFPPPMVIPLYSGMSFALPVKHDESA